MQILERSKDEIVNKAEKMSDFLKMEYLELCSERLKEIEILKYCYSQLVNLYEKRVMYSDALKYLAKLQSLAVGPMEKFQLCEKEIEILIKAGNYEQVMTSYKEAIKSTNETGSLNLKRKIIKLYREQANKFELGSKYSSLSKLYERLIPWLTDTEKNEIMNRLFVVYKKLGKVRESIELEKRIHK